MPEKNDCRLPSKKKKKKESNGMGLAAKVVASPRPKEKGKPGHGASNGQRCRGGKEKKKKKSQSLIFWKTVAPRMLERGRKGEGRRLSLENSPKGRKFGFLKGGIAPND